MFFSTGPRFSGKDPKAWISAVERTLFNFKIHPAYHVQFAMELLDGAALTWARPRELLLLNRGWNDFVYRLLCEFDQPYREDWYGDSAVYQENVIGEFNKMVQTSTVQEYQERFERLKHLVAAKYPHIDESYYVSCCINGLKEEIRSTLVSWCPLSVEAVFGIAHLKEYMLSTAQVISVDEGNETELIQESMSIVDISPEEELYEFHETIDTPLIFSETLPVPKIEDFNTENSKVLDVDQVKDSNIEAADDISNTEDVEVFVNALTTEEIASKVIVNANLEDVAVVECTAENVQARDVDQDPTLDKLSDMLIAAPLESLQIGEVVPECHVTDIVPPNSAWILSTQPIKGCATSSYEFAGDSVEDNSVLHAENNVDTRKGSKVLNMGVDVEWSRCEYAEDTSHQIADVDQETPILNTADKVYVEKYLDMLEITNPFFIAPSMIKSNSFLLDDVCAALKCCSFHYEEDKGGKAPRQEVSKDVVQVSQVFELYDFRPQSVVPISLEVCVRNQQNDTVSQNFSGSGNYKFSATCCSIQVISESTDLSRGSLENLMERVVKQKHLTFEWEPGPDGCRQTKVKLQFLSSLVSLSKKATLQKRGGTNIVDWIMLIFQIILQLCIGIIGSIVSFDPGIILKLLFANIWMFPCDVGAATVVSNHWVVVENIRSYNGNAIVERMRKYVSSVWVFSSTESYESELIADVSNSENSKVAFVCVVFAHAIGLLAAYMLRSSILQYVPDITDIVCLFNWQIQVACGEAYNRMVAQVLLLVDFIIQSFGMANRKLYRDFQSMKHQLLGSAERVNPWGYIMLFPNGFIVMKIIIFSCIMPSSSKFDHYDCRVLWRSLESLTIFSEETSVVMIDISVDLIHDEEHRTGVIAVHLWYISLGSVSSFQGVQSYSSRLGVCKNYKFQCLVYYEQWFHANNVLQGLMGESTRTQRWKDNEQLTPKHVRDQLFTVDRLHKFMLNDSLQKYIAAIILSDSGPYTAVFLWLIAWQTGFFTTLFRRNSDNPDPQGFPPAYSNSGEYIWSSHITALSHAVSNFLEYGDTRDPIVGYSICLRITRPLKYQDTEVEGQ